MCGLFGFSGIKPANTQIIKLLWVYSQKRGTDSTGVYRNRETFKQWNIGQTSGAALDASYGLLLDPTTIDHTTIGHCRAKSVGIVSEKNTHPFKYNINDEIWVFAHNGTIRNIDALAKKYNIAREAGETDSQTFGHILAEGNLDVLLEYEGTAAFSLYNETKNLLYLWRGVSKHELSTKPTEERPLHYHKNKYGMYWASEPLNLASSLNSDRDIFTFKPNTLYTIENGIVTNIQEFNRENFNSVSEYDYDNYYGGKSYYRSKHSSQKGEQSVLPYTVPYTAPLREPDPMFLANGKVYYHHGLYYRQAMPLTGEFYLQEDGTVSDSADFAASVYHFYAGYMLNDADTMHKFLKNELNLEVCREKSYDFAKEILHEEHLLIAKFDTSSPWYYHKRTFKQNCVVKPKFGYYAYHLNGRGNVEKFERIVHPKEPVSNWEIFVNQ